MDYAYFGNKKVCFYLKFQEIVARILQFRQKIGTISCKIQG